MNADSAQKRTARDVQLETMRVDDEGVRYISFLVSIALDSRLNEQRAKLDKVDASLPGKMRYQAARQAGCCAAIAKGAKDRSLEPNRIFLPGTELAQNGNGHVRISALKAELPVPAGVHVKNITFMRDPSIPEFGVAWTGALEVTEEK